MKWLTLFFIVLSCICHAQTDSTDKDFLKINNEIENEIENEEEEMSIEDLLADDAADRIDYVTSAFKSTRVVNAHSMEMLGAGVLDFRIMHRFGLLKGGASELFGLDGATMRMSFDYGLTRNATIGIGRSTLNKELDGFLKYRLLSQSTGKRNVPLSIVYATGITLNTVKYTNTQIPNYFTSRLAFYHQLIFGRKFSQSFTFQLSPIFLHQNIVEFASDFNDIYALEIGGRIKLSRRVAFLIDAMPILSGARPNYHQTPISIGFDIETGGHVFQLHFSNARGMNERAFLANTIQSWGKGEIHFGFNLSRVFTIKKNTDPS